MPPSDLLFSPISPLDRSLEPALQALIDTKTKPVGSLGDLEALALQIGLIQQTTTPALQHPHLVVFAGDHGIARSGVSAYPQDVTWQMVANYLAGGAAVNVFARQNGLTLRVVDAGVNHTFEAHPELVDAKLGMGTANFLEAPAMPVETARAGLQRGARLVRELGESGCNVIGFGEMGIGNTTSAAALMSRLLDIPPEFCVGRGTGVDEAGVAFKAEVVQQALHLHAEATEPLEILAALGGFEIVQMAGAMLEAASRRMIVLVDGFIATSAMLAAHAFEPAVREYAVFCHRSEETGHRLMLERLGATPLIDLGLRLGEGTGCALAYPLLRSSVAFLNEMASFERAGVSSRQDGGAA
ncbi:MAG: nicotinate-nucleotide--dimethylbenzimidazole phosphoribosyltransferase [Bacteroidota bacterium]